MISKMEDSVIHLNKRDLSDPIVAMAGKNPILIERRYNLYSRYNYKIQIYAHFKGAFLRSDAMKGDFV